MPAAFTWSQLRTPALMGILNITPDSFSDGNQFLDPTAAVARAKTMLQHGAQILDLGAEASSFFRKGVEPVPPEEQIRRLTPILAAFRNDPHTKSAIISIDTRSSRVIEALAEFEIAIINDISAGEHDPRMFDVAKKQNTALILMHIDPIYPQTPLADNPAIVADVVLYLEDRLEAARDAGIPREKLAIDPGLGFGKTPNDNWLLALNFHAFPDYPLVLGASRKRFLETPPPSEIAEEWKRLIAALQDPTHYRDPASAAITRITARQGIPIHRLHNVPLAAKALTM